MSANVFASLDYFPISGDSVGSPCSDWFHDRSLCVWCPIQRVRWHEKSPISRCLVFRRGPFLHPAGESFSRALGYSSTAWWSVWVLYRNLETKMLSTLCTASQGDELGEKLLPFRWILLGFKRESKTFDMAIKIFTTINSLKPTHYIQLQGENDIICEDRFLLEHQSDVITDTRSTWDQS